MSVSSTQITPAAGKPAFIAGDWGTSHLRLSLCNATGDVLAQQSGPGAAAINGAFAETLSALLAPWQPVHGALPVLLCGMVGSRLGWREVPYVPCPAAPSRIADAMVEVTAGVHIIPGLSCSNPLGAFDVMRGEETQILGALQLAPQLQQGQHLLCLPGTHSKWVLLVDGNVHEFLTTPTGELFAVLRQHSVLVRDSGPLPDVIGNGFGLALTRVSHDTGHHLQQHLFECRSRQLSGELSAADASDFLSGLLIGDDVAGALALYQPSDETIDSITLIGAPAISGRYAHALEAFDIPSQQLHGDRAALAGLTALFQRNATGA